MLWGFFWSTLEEAQVFNAPTLRNTCISMDEPKNCFVSETRRFLLSDEGEE
jgi:hypothetical protein